MPLAAFNLSARHGFAALVITGALAACSVQLVAPYNPELAQRASAMQAEVAAWELRMRAGAGTAADDPRHPDVAGTLDRWRGEAEAMLTLAIANDPRSANCGAALKAAAGVVEGIIPPELQRSGISAAPPGAAATEGGCEAALVAAVETGIDDIEKALKYCRTDWVEDAYFDELRQKGSPPKPPRAVNPAAQEAVRKSCSFEFRASSNAASVAAIRHGPAVSALSTTLQAIVYIENRKRLTLSK